MKEKLHRRKNNMMKMTILLPKIAISEWIAILWLNITTGLIIAKNKEKWSLRATKHKAVLI